MSDLAKLNRLRVNAGKSELRSWKASREALAAQIKKFEDDGFNDTVPGANVNAQPIAPDPEVAKAFAETPKPKTEDEPPSLADSALAKNIANGNGNDKPKNGTTKVKARLARGLDTDPMAHQSRIAIQQQHKRDKDAEKKATPQKAEPSKGKIAGEVDAKKDPDKAARQKQHIAEKQAKRAAAGPKPEKPKDDKNFAVADLARDLDIDPKVARAKLRRHEDAIAKLHSKGQDRWTFPNGARKEIEKILIGAK